MAGGLDVEVDGRAIDPGQCFLFGRVLDSFFGLSVDIDGFTRLSMRLEGPAEAIHRWSPSSGARTLA